MSLLQKIQLLSDSSDQTFSIELGGNPYILRVLWNERFGYFSLSINTADDEPILTNIKMVKNYDLTSRFKDLRLPFGGLFFVQEKGNSARCGYDEIGINYNLYYYEPDPEEAVVQVFEQVSVPVIGSVWDSALSEWDSGSSAWDE